MCATTIGLPSHFHIMQKKKQKTTIPDPITANMKEIFKGASEDLPYNTFTSR